MESDAVIIGRKICQNRTGWNLNFLTYMYEEWLVGFNISNKNEIEKAVHREAEVCAFTTNNA